MSFDKQILTVFGTSIEDIDWFQIKDGIKTVKITFSL